MIGSIRVGAVIPAAGLSSRMGTFKPLLPFSESTVIETSVARALKVCDTAVAVLGNRADDLRSLLTRRFGDRLRFITNADYAATDMLASVKLGLQKLGECDAFFLVPADMPMISEKTYRKLIEAFDGSPRALIPTVRGRRGHPPLIPAALIPAILGYEGDGGLRAIFDKVGAEMIEVGDDGALRDLDTPEDYRAAIDRMNTNQMI